MRTELLLLLILIIIVIVFILWRNRELTCDTSEKSDNNDINQQTQINNLNLQITNLQNQINNIPEPEPVTTVKVAGATTPAVVSPDTEEIFRMNEVVGQDWAEILEPVPGENYLRILEPGEYLFTFVHSIGANFTPNEDSLIIYEVREFDDSYVQVGVIGVLQNTIPRIALQRIDTSCRALTITDPANFACFVNNTTSLGAPGSFNSSMRLEVTRLSGL